MFKNSLPCGSLERLPGSQQLTLDKGYRVSAADEAIEDRLNDLDIKPKGLRPQRSEGAISIEKLNPSSPSREQSGMQAQSAPPRHLMDS